MSYTHAHPPSARTAGWQVYRLARRIGLHKRGERSLDFHPPTGQQSTGRTTRTAKQSPTRDTYTVPKHFNIHVPIHVQIQTTIQVHILICTHPIHVHILAPIHVPIQVTIHLPTHVTAHIHILAPIHLPTHVPTHVSTSTRGFSCASRMTVVYSRGRPHPPPSPMSYSRKWLLIDSPERGPRPYIRVERHRRREDDVLGVRGWAV